MPPLPLSLTPIDLDFWIHFAELTEEQLQERAMVTLTHFVRNLGIRALRSKIAVVQEIRDICIAANRLLLQDMPISVQLGAILTAVRNVIPQNRVVGFSDGMGEHLFRDYEGFEIPAVRERFPEGLEIPAIRERFPEEPEVPQIAIDPVVRTIPAAVPPTDRVPQTKVVSCISGDENHDHELAKTRFLNDINRTNQAFVNLPLAGMIVPDACSKYADQFLSDSLLKNISEEDVVLIWQPRDGIFTDFNVSIMTTASLVAYVAETRGDSVILHLAGRIGLGSAVVTPGLDLAPPPRFEVRRNTLRGAALTLVNGFLRTKVLSDRRCEKSKEEAANIQGKTMSTYDGFLVSISSNKIKTENSLNKATFFSRCMSSTIKRLTTPQNQYAEVIAADYKKKIDVQIEAESQQRALCNVFSDITVASFRLIHHLQIPNSYVRNLLEDFTCPPLSSFNHSWEDTFTMVNGKHLLMTTLRHLAAFLVLYMGDHWENVFESLLSSIAAPTEVDTVWGHKQWAIGYFAKVFHTVFDGILLAFATSNSSFFENFLPGRAIDFRATKLVVEICTAILSSRLKPVQYENNAFILDSMYRTGRHSINRVVAASPITSKRKKLLDSSDTSSNSSEMLSKTIIPSSLKKTNKPTNSAKKVRLTTPTQLKKKKVCFRDFMYQIKALQPDGSPCRQCTLEDKCHFSHIPIPHTKNERAAIALELFPSSLHNDLLTRAQLAIAKGT